MAGKYNTLWDAHAELSFLLHATTNVGTNDIRLYFISIEELLHEMPLYPYIEEGYLAMKRAALLDADPFSSGYGPVTGWIESFLYRYPSDTPLANIPELGGSMTGGGSTGEVGTSADDVFYSRSQEDVEFRGEYGLDTVVYEAGRGEHRISIMSNGDVGISKPQGGTDTLISIERAEFSDGVLLFDIASTNAPAAYRLYGGAFDRTPDEGGLLFWVDYLDKGGSLFDAATGFIGSPEFNALYGAGLSDAQFVDQLYLNVLGRPGEAAGVDYWNGYLSDGGGRAAALVNFTQLDEYVGLSLANIENGYWVS